MNRHLPTKLGLSQSFPCNYLPNKQEQLLVILEPNCYNDTGYEALLNLGFRRSGDQIYRPHCAPCFKCRAIRVLVNDFIPSRSQKRKIKKAQKHFTVKSSVVPKDEYYSLYEKYINERHNDSSMFPANEEQYKSFLLCSWLPITYIELYDDDKLIAIAVTDLLNNSLSAIYTFFDPEYENFSIGTVMVLEQIKLANSLNKKFVYLGYQIDDCKKMNYKNQFKNHQILEFERWISI
ncbi:arginyltransferase [Pseudoalteromonas denitrificans]|uniref:Aspartate/glutamate leucyltransferase n=1 Tax=Pseudoalteromonas denitrificans DSM 6059 TaxID=1123010 RepID=A0A1I1RX43_9GAMM|nr:arginyltransferase [Pseudoalteromonas denitrificans]SFD38667.1 arginine-tRNA-protein transferase [Pseudoalteromonas denitrificans DSM 6059]